MNRRLVWIAMVSFGISAACVLLAVSISAAGWGDGGRRSWADIFQNCAAMPWTKKAGSNNGEGASGPRIADLEWQGSNAIKVNIPARVHYQPGPEPQASVTGDAELVRHVRMHGGTIEWDTAANCFTADDLVVRLTGPAVTAWTLNGSGQLDLADIKQDALRIEIRGSGTVTVSGETREASFDAAGSSSADLSRLAVQRANVRIRGSAEVDLSPREEADISITGSGAVRLHGAVARLNSHVSGSGQIKQVP